MNLWSQNFSQKTNKKLQGFLPSLTGQKSLQFFVRFLGEVLSSQIHSEINWPLGVTFTSLNKLKFFQLSRFEKKNPIHKQKVDKSANGNFEN